MENTKTVRVTKTMRYEDIIALLTGETPAHGTDTDRAVKFIKGEMALLAKKNSGSSKKLTATQTENEKYKGLIMDFLSFQTEGKTCTEIAKSIPELSDFNNQKIASLMRQLVEAEKVSKAVVKGKSLFTII